MFGYHGLMWAGAGQGLTSSPSTVLASVHAQDDVFITWDDVVDPTFVAYYIIYRDAVEVGRYTLAAPNVVKLWKGAVEPTRTQGAGNEYQAWKGAVEPYA